MPRPIAPLARCANTDFATGAVFLAIGVTALALVPFEVQRDGFAEFGNMRSPAFFPIVAAVATMVLAFTLIVRGVLRGAPPVNIANPRRVVSVLVALAAATALIFWAGYLIAATMLIGVLSFAFGNRRIGLVALMAIVTPVAIFLLFDGVLNVLLPAGPF